MTLSRLACRPAIVQLWLCLAGQRSGRACAGLSCCPTFKRACPHTYTCAHIGAHAHASPSAHNISILVRQSDNYINISELPGLSALSASGTVGQPVRAGGVIQTYLPTFSGRLQVIARTLADGIKTHLLPLESRSTK